MKPIFTFLIIVLIGLSAQAQNYYIKLDTFSVLTLKTGKEYTINANGKVLKEKLSSIKSDTFYFEKSKYYYKDLYSIKNPKRNGFFDAITFPVTIGSCVALSTIPITYVKGYFLADSDVMLSSVGLFIVETIIFASSRSYLSKNKKWIKIAELEKLQIEEK